MSEIPYLKRKINMMCECIYKLSLDAFIYHGHRKAIRILRFKFRKELNISIEEVKPYKIYMNIPKSLMPFVNVYKRREEIKQLVLSEKFQI